MALLDDPFSNPTYSPVQKAIEKLMGAWVGIVVGVSVLVIIPLTVWFTWRDRSSLLFPMAVSVFSICFGWTGISLLQLYRTIGALGLTPSERGDLFSGPRPDDPDLLRAWRWGWQFMLGAIATLLSLIAIPIIGSFR